MSDRLVVTEEVRTALADGGPVVALETNGFPSPEGMDVARRSEACVRAAGAVPATIGVVDGELRVGLDDAELERFGAAGGSARKVGPRDIAPCLTHGELGATTVGSTLAIAALAGIRFMATSGLGGVHRGFAERPDISADLAEMTRAPVLVVASGVKSLLDVPATAELLESLSIPVLGWRADTIPLYYVATGGPPVSSRVDSAAEAAAIARHHWGTLHRSSALLLARPPTESLTDVEALIVGGLAEADRDAIVGPAVTPHVLAYVHERSGGRTAAASKQLILDNSALAAQVAVAYAGV